MKKSDFYFDLPEQQIAQTPIEPRDHSRMMVVDRQTGACSHRHFYDIYDLLNPGDLLVLNDSRVIPARLYGVREGSLGAVEVLLLEHRELNLWECAVRPGKKFKPGNRFVFGDGLLTATVKEVLENGNRILEMHHEGSFYELLETIGQMPLPHYIKTQLQDKERYQTVYARERGSAAAPTAGLHFTKGLLKKIEEKGVNLAYVTLHVGIGTFRPVKTEEITDHQMHSEHYILPERTAQLINETKARGGRVIAVGTTSCRTLESVATKLNGSIRPDEGYTNIFIYPGYQFKVLDGLITNFHLPESTLIMLVSAFLGREKTLAAYRTAVEEQYRFYSFGDAMVIL